MTKPTTLSPEERAVLDHIRPNVDRLAPGDLTTAAGVFGKNQWNALPPSERKANGHHIAKLVALGLVPLERAGFTSQRHNQYRRI